METKYWILWWSINLLDKHVDVSCITSITISRFSTWYSEDKL